jgi:hypothetical protein
LSWLAEIELDRAGGGAPLADLPAGVPVRVVF